MKNKITTILILLLTIISNVGIANTELQLKDKFLCKRIHIDENINVEKVNKKIDFLITLPDTPLNVNAIRFIKGQRAFYNTATNVIMLPVDVPNYYLEYALYHEQAHLTYRRNNIAGSKVWLEIKSKLEPQDVSDYAPTNEEEFFCDMVAYHKLGKSFGKEVNKLIIML